MKVPLLFFLVASLGLVDARMIPTDGGSGNGGGPDPNRFIVVTKNNDQANAAVAAAASKVHFTLEKQSAIVATIPPQALQGLKNRPDIISVEVDSPRYTMANQSLRGTLEAATSRVQRKLAQSTPFGITMVQADLVTYNGNSAKTICIIDSGYQRDHPDLKDTGVTGITWVDDQYNPVASWDKDQCSHGTHVAGTIAAIDNQEGVIGVAPGVNLFIVKAFGDDCGWAYASSLVQALNLCEENIPPSSIVTMSLGGGNAVRTEEKAFQDAYDRGMLSFAAAGNAGNTANDYPASYDSVISVAAVDSSEVVAGFSQKNSQVELAAPGVGVLSTVSSRGASSLSVDDDGIDYSANPIDGAPEGSAAGDLVNCGTGESTCSGAHGMVCLIERGTISFFDKIQACDAGGGVAAIIYNNAPGNFLGNIGAGNSVSIPAVSISQDDGRSLVGTKLGTTAVVVVVTLLNDYDYYDGTSMATPHASGVAALVWSNFMSCSNDQIRAALATTAKDMGVTGRDNSYGYGIVQAKAAFDHLVDNDCDSTCTPSQTGCDQGSVTCCDGEKCASSGRGKNKVWQCVEAGGGAGGGCTKRGLGETCKSNNQCCSQSCNSNICV